MTSSPSSSSAHLMLQQLEEPAEEDAATETVHEREEKAHSHQMLQVKMCIADCQQLFIG
jgi:hypothetical protein